MKLCSFCNSSKANAFDEGECFICKNNLASLEKIAEKAATLIPKDANYFSLSTTVPNEWLIKEEFVWDIKINNTISIKTFINQFLNKKIQSLCGKKPRNDGDVILHINLPNGDVSVFWNDLFVFGKYKKLKEGFSQTRWICSSCNGNGCEKCKNVGKFYHSVEEEIGEVFKSWCGAEDYVMHASGREDIDVSNIAGRPFVMQLKAARIRKPDFSKIANEINKKGNVSVDNLKVVKRSSVEAITSSHFDKSYFAKVEFEKELTEEQIKNIVLISGKIIKQKTPSRVEHRRAFLERKRKILSIEFISKKNNLAEFLITTEPGTYIKELISGDNGRTKPSFSSVTNMHARCIALRVEKIFDDFLNSIKL